MYTELPHAPQGSVVIPEDKAKEGIEHIRQILKENPSIKYIFPMSLQVNYWLQKLGFYLSDDDFVKNSEPKEKGLNSSSPYYEAKKKRTFLLVCGNQYEISDNKVVIPVLHSKNYPLKGNFIKAYSECYEKIKKYFVF